MRIEVKEVKVAYIVGMVSKELIEAMTSMNATMYDDEGGGQYCIDDLMGYFDEDSDEWKELNRLMSVEGYDYLEYS